MKNKTTIIMSLLFLGQLLWAQTENYWSWNFNTHSSLMGGSVVAGNAGPSAIFYNPALIDQHNNPSLTLSANVMSMQFFSVENVAGNDVDGYNSRFKVQPKFISYVLSTKNKKLGLELAFLSPTSEEIRLNIQHTDTLDVIDRTAGDEVYQGYLNYQRKFDDAWAGFGLSYAANEHFSFGGSLFFADRIHRYIYHQTSTAISPNDSVDINGTLEPAYLAESSIQEEADFWHVSLLFKTGVAFHTLDQRLSIGLNLTFPSIPLFGRANVRKAYMRSNVYNDDTDDFTSNEYAIAVDNGTSDVRVKSPFSAAFGIQYIAPNKNSTFSISGEYFHEIDSYDLIGSDTPISWVPSYAASSGNQMSYQHEADKVFNAGFGYKQDINQTVTLLSGFRTDFTAGNKEKNLFQAPLQEIRKLHIDKYHISTGLVFHVKKFHFVTGAQYSFAREKSITQVVNFTHPEEYFPLSEMALEGQRESTAKASINEVALFFGFSVGL